MTELQIKEEHNSQQLLLYKEQRSSYWINIFDSNSYYEDKDIRKLLSDGWRIANFCDAISVSAHGSEYGRFTLLLEKY